MNFCKPEAEAGANPLNFVECLYLAQEGDEEKGRDYLVKLVKEERDAYLLLTPEEKQVLVDAHMQEKTKENTTRRISGRKRARDATTTLNAMHHECVNLQSQTGVEVMVYAVPGTTDVPLKGVTWATGGITTFMDGTMRVDSQDLLGRMEGHVMHGYAGASQNHAQRRAKIRDEVRDHIVNQLRIITCNDSARIEFVNYWEKVVRRYLVLLEGWPADLDFKSLHTSAVSFPSLMLLQEKCKKGTLFWRKLTPAEFESLDAAHKVSIEQGFIPAPRPRQVRSDCGQKRKRTQANEEDDDDDDDED
ncbi:hypothetical protein BDN72DRAFT_864871 [Pluteus cervinus]|uniref:Uncharacterized protein n=1 Tax=Pluteus cervinus TaxID=181527 RepID=A0ACD3A326_9AGAR|nr:hypothetical protein BDN72DRAFT_864871 [Pluteus cervinus]